MAEEVVSISMPEDPSMAAKIGWYLGNRHLPIEVREKEILLESFPTLTDSLDRIWNRLFNARRRSQLSPSLRTYPLNDESLHAIRPLS